MALAWHGLRPASTDGPEAAAELAGHLLGGLAVGVDYGRTADQVLPAEQLVAGAVEHDGSHLVGDAARGAHHVEAGGSEPLADGAEPVVHRHAQRHDRSPRG